MIGFHGIVKFRSPVVLHGLKLVSAIALLFAGTTPAAEPSDQWEVDLDVYLWAASAGGHTASDHPLDVSFGDVLKKLKLGFMGGLTFRKGKFSLLTDVIYGDLGDKNQVMGSLLGEPIDVSVKADMTALIVTAAGGYSLIYTEQNKLDILLGARYLNQDLGLSFSLNDRNRNFDMGFTALDGIVGLNGQAALSEKWYFNYYADVGTGDTDLTWQALAGLGYKFNKLDVKFGYRYLDWNFDDSDAGGKALNDLNIHGPYAGVRFSW